MVVAAAVHGSRGRGRRGLVHLRLTGGGGGSTGFGGLGEVNGANILTASAEAIRCRSVTGYLVGLVCLFAQVRWSRVLDETGR